MNEFSSKFEKDLPMVSCFSSNKVRYVSRGISRRMTSTRELFSSLEEHNSGVQVELGDNTKYPVAGFDTIPFQLKSGNTLECLVELKVIFHLIHFM